MALNRVLQLVPGSTLTEFDVAGDPERAESLDIAHTPTTIIRDSYGHEVYRAVGVPSLPQLLVATARARDAAAPAR
ncbi:thioredoxin family protein [Cryobacterium sp. AP23]